MDKRAQTCCFSGHRTIPSDQLSIVAAKTEQVIRNLITKRKILFFGVGGAVGYDLLAAQIVLNLRRTEFPWIKVILIYPFDGYQDLWTQSQREQYAQIWNQFDKRVCISKKGSKETFLARNRHMVDHSSVLICYYNEKQFRSGTGQCVRYAKKQGLEVINMADSFH